MSTLPDFPNIRPSLLMDFANSRRTHPLITCTRASAATCFGSDGKLRTVGNNIPRIDYDPVTGKCLGLFREEARTNLLLNSVFAGAASGTPGTAPTNYGFGVGNGSTTVIAGGLVTTLRLSATAARHFLAYNNVTVAVGQYTFSVSCNVFTAAAMSASIGRIDGTAVSTVKYFIDGVEVTANTSNGLGRKKLSLVIDVTTAGAINLRFGVGVSTGVTADLEVGTPQFELGSFATSLIATTTSSLARAADLISLANFSWTNWASGVTLLVDAETPAAWPTDSTLLSFNNGTGQVDQIDIRYTGTGVATRSRTGSTTQASTIHTGVPLAGVARVAVSVSATNFISAANGAAAYSIAAPFVPASTLDRLAIGFRGASNNPFTGHIRRIYVYPAALTSAQLQRLTA